VPATLPDGAIRMAPGFAIGTEGVTLQKDAILDLAVATTGVPPGLHPALYAAESGGGWRRVGGTLDGTGTRITTSIPAAGSYALFGASPGADLGEPLALSLTPRVLASRGAFAGAPVRIGFTLAREASVRVTIHNRAGRLVRIVTSGQQLAAGTNVVTWDGRDEDRHDVDSGMYFVTVEASGRKRTEAVAVVR
jgi:hypothetical protein